MLTELELKDCGNTLSFMFQQNKSAINLQSQQHTCEDFKLEKNLPVSHDYTLYGLHLCAAFF